MIAMLDPRVRLGRVAYLLYGLGLGAIKTACDLAVSHHHGKQFSLAYYISPPDSPLLAPGAAPAYWFALWGVALPFIGLGMVLSVRRLRDAGLPDWLVVLFFAPFANLLFFASLVAMPPREASLAKGSSPAEASRIRGMLMGMVAGATVAIAAVAIAVGLLKTYGAGLFLGSPSIAGFVAAVVAGRMCKSELSTACAAALGALALCYAVLAAFAAEGMICMLMALPLAGGSAITGAIVGHLLTGASPGPVRTLPAAILLPLILAAERPQPLTTPLPVETVVEIDALPELVWRHVVAFDPLPAPDHWLFSAGVAAPMGAVIEGAGVGAVRRCQFTTGAFVEPITTWEVGRHLAFGVTEQPDPLREWTFWPGPRPPHLDGYLQVERGEFVLERLEGGRTRLTGRTWYHVAVYPQPYWRAWSDYVIGRIHARVLDAIETRAEADAAR